MELTPYIKSLYQQIDIVWKHCGLQCKSCFKEVNVLDRKICKEIKKIQKAKGLI